MINQVTICGSLGRDPEIRHLQNTKVANLSVATSEYWKDKTTGERKSNTEWHRIVVFGNLAQVCEDYLRKGSKVFIVGKLRTRKWTDSNNIERYTTEIVVSGPAAVLRNLSPREKGDAHEEEQAATAATEYDPDDDIPF